MKIIGGMALICLAAMLLLPVLEVPWAEIDTRMLITLIVGALYSLGGGMLWSGVRR